MNWPPLQKKEIILLFFPMNAFPVHITLYFDFITFNPFLALYIWKETITEKLLSRPGVRPVQSTAGQIRPSVSILFMAELDSNNRDRELAWEAGQY